MAGRSSNFTPSLIVVLLAALIIVFDVSMPLGVAGGVPYVALVLVGLWFTDRRAVLVLAALGSVLTVVGYYFSDPAGIPWMVLVNRGLAMFAIWVTAVLAYQRWGWAAALRDTKMQLDIAIESFSDGFVLFDADDRFVFANDAYLDSHPSIRGIQTPGTSFETVARKLATAGFYGNTPEEIENCVQARLEHYRSGKSFEYRMKDGRWYQMKEYETRDGGIALVRIDITERKAMEYQLVHAQRMEAIGQLTGGIAHDFNNILGIIMGNLEILQHMVSGDEEASSCVETALKGTERGVDLTRKLIGFSRKEARGKKLTSVNEFIWNMEELIVKSLTVAINVEHHLANDLWPVEVDPGDLQDTILNLTLNARDAMPDGGSLVIETRNKVLDEDYVRRNPQGKAGEFVMLSVSDTGHGMTPEVRERVLEPFFSTKEEGKGTGLGLGMVYGFVQRSKGHMKIYSEPGEGTTIRIYLPQVHEEGESEGKEPAQADLPRGSETILVVDDEEQLVDIAVSHLEGLGYRTVTANGGKQALEVLQGDADIDLLFSDVIMPGGMDGYELAKQAMEKRPNLKVLLTSGFTKKREELNNRDKAVYAKLAANLLSKPYNQSELARSVRRVLDEEG